MSRRMHIRPRPGVNPLALFFFLLMGTAAGPKPTRAQSKQQYPDGSRSITGWDLDRGDELRLTFHDGSRQTWKLGGISERGLQVYRPGLSGIESIPYEDLLLIERKGPNRAVQGFAAGAAAGIGLALGLTIVQSAASNDPYAPLWFVIYAPIGMTLGALSGMAIGSQRGWEPVETIQAGPYEELSSQWPSDSRELLDGTSSPPELRLGQRLRITFQDREQYVVRFVHSDVDSIRVRADRPYSSTVAFGYDELSSVETWFDPGPKEASMSAVAVGAGVGGIAGWIYGDKSEQQSDQVAYAMAGATIGALTGGLLSRGSGEEPHWKKLFVLPQKDGVTVGYHTRF